jgi:hypothetical protein
MVRLVANCRAEITQLFRDVCDMNRTDLVLLFTLLILLRHHQAFWYLSGPMIALTVAALTWSRLRTNSLLWFVALALLSMAGALNWYVIDNHQYVLIYWCLSIFLALLLGEEDRDQCLAKNGSLLIGLSMLLAMVQKLITPSYVNGSFFEYLLLCSPRLEAIAWMMGGISLDDLKVNRALQQQLTHSSLDGATMEAVTLHLTDRLHWLAIALTWITVLIEGGLGVLFLVPRASDSLRGARSVLLVVFIATTYAIAPVIGFGWILITMALAQLPTRCWKLRVTLVILFVILPIYKVPRPAAKVVSFIEKIIG